jgi:hypothetical protein
MALAKHPTVLRVRGSWTDGHRLSIALRLMTAGSAADVMRYGWPGGFSEDVVKAILVQALEGLKYAAWLLCRHGALMVALQLLAREWPDPSRYQGC